MQHRWEHHWYWHWKWRQMTGATTLVDLKSTYLQLYIEEKLWRCQLVKYRGTYILFNPTGVWFGAHDYDCCNNKNCIKKLDTELTAAPKQAISFQLFTIVADFLILQLKKHLDVQFFSQPKLIKINRLKSLTSNLSN